MKVLFTGGRDFTDRSLLFLRLDAFDSIVPITEVVVGDARGVDALVWAWAKARNKKWFREKAHWDKLGKYAGIERNERMVNLYNPDILIAFPGGNGTKHCANYAKKSGIEVMYAMQDMPYKERAISEEFRIVGKDWVEKNKAASLLEENKKVVFSELLMEASNNPDKKVPAWQAEAMVYCSDRWREYLNAMTEARTAANLARIKMRWVEMKFQEQNSAEANARSERKMTG